MTVPFVTVQPYTWCCPLDNTIYWSCLDVELERKVELHEFFGHGIVPSDGLIAYSEEFSTGLLTFNLGF